MIYIPSRQRTEMLKVTSKNWPAPVTLVVEPQEEDTYRAALPGVALLVLPQNDRGIGFARDMIINHGYQMGLDAVIMADDDLLLEPNVTVLLEYMAAHQECPQIGAWMQVYRKFGMLREGEAQPSWTSFGNALFAINVNLALEVGGYDHRLRFFEDCDLAIRMVIKSKQPRMVSCLTETKQIGVRGNPGGCASQDQSKEEQVRATINILKNDRGWAEYVGVREREDLAPKIRFQWRRLYRANGVEC